MVHPRCAPCVRHLQNGAAKLERLAIGMFFLRDLHYLELGQGASNAAATACGHAARASCDAAPAVAAVAPDGTVGKWHRRTSTCRLGILSAVFKDHAERLQPTGVTSCNLDSFDGVEAVKHANLGSFTLTSGGQVEILTAEEADLHEIKKEWLSRGILNISLAALSSLHC